MKSVMALVLTGSGTVVAQDAVQWRVEDGGNGHWYLVDNPGLITWQEGVLRAESFGGHSATLKTESELDFVYNLIDFDKQWGAPNAC